MYTYPKMCYSICMSERVPEATVSSRFCEQLCAAGFSVEQMERDGKCLLVCNVTPARLPWNPQEKHNPDQERYRTFYETYREICKANGWEGTHISSKGLTEAEDVRRVTDPETHDSFFIVSRGAYDKLHGSGLHLRNEPVREGIRSWIGTLSGKSADPVQNVSAQALMSTQHGQLVAVAAGLKPLSVELDLQDADVAAVVGSVPQLRTWIRNDKKNPVRIVYNVPAAAAVIRENHALFSKLRLNTGDVDTTVRTLVLCYEKGSIIPGTNQDDVFEALGLLLGYDKTSCREYRHAEIDWSKTFMPPDHVGSHPMNANPFNYYDVDYWIHDPATNADFQSLKAKYDALPLQIQEQLCAGTSPLGVLQRLAAGSGAMDAPVQTGRSIRDRLAKLWPF
jgi:hypothetical protein